MSIPHTIEELEAAEAAHDPATCTDPTCAAAPEGSTWMGMGMSVAPNGTVSFHHSDESAAALRLYRDREWADLCHRYLADPDDFVTAHNWLTRHPIFHRFHVRRDAAPLPADAEQRRQAIAAAEGEAYLIDDQGLGQVWLSVFNVDEDDDLGPAGSRVLIEHGPYLWASDNSDDEHTVLGGTATHDTDVDAYAATYEAAIISMARNVHTKYGTDRSRI